VLLPAEVVKICMLEVVQTLVQNGAEINIESYQGDAAISLAAGLNHQNIVDYLLKKLEDR